MLQIQALVHILLDLMYLSKSYTANAIGGHFQCNHSVSQGKTQLKKNIPLPGRLPPLKDIIRRMRKIMYFSSSFLCISDVIPHINFLKEFSIYSSLH